MRPLALALFVLGCADVAAPESAQLELGTGTWRFEPIEDGASLPLVAGAQGGWHLWLSVRAHGIEADAGRLVFELEPADESAPPQRTEVGIRFDPPDDEGWRNYLGWAAILPAPSCAVGRMHRIHATVTTAAGERLEAERFVVPAPGEHPPPPCAR